MALPALEIQISADTNAAEVGFKKLSRSMDGLEQAANEYQAALSRVNRAEKAGLITARQAAAAIRGVEQSYEEAARQAASYSGAAVNVQRRTTGLVGAFSRLSTTTRGGAGGIQNVAFQVGDFATQVGAGTSASVALGQQLPQLLGGFGALGAVMGAVVAVGVPLAASFIDLGDEAEQTATEIDDFVSALGRAQDLADRANTPILELAETFGEFADEVQRASRIAAQAALSQAMGQYQETAGQVRDTLAELTAAMDDYDRTIAVNMMLQRGLGERTLSNASAFDELSENMDNARADLEAVAAEIGLSVGDAVRLRNALDQVGSAQGPKQLAEAASAALDTIGKIVTQSENVPPEVANIVSELERVLTAAAQAVVAFQDIEGAAEGAAGAASKIRVGASVAGGRGGDPRDFGDLRGMQDPYGFRKQISGEDDDGGKRAGGGAQRPDRIGALAQSLLTEAEQLEAWRVESMAALQDFNALELEVLGGHNEAKLRLEEEYLNRLGELQDNERKARLDGIKGALGDAASLMQSENEKLFKIGKAASIANAVVNGYEAATEAWNKGMAAGGPPLAAAFTAASLARTGALISQIQSQGPRGSAGGSAGGGASSAAAAPPAPPPVQRSLTLVGDTFNRQQAIRIAEFLNDGTDDGLVIRGRR